MTSIDGFFSAIGLSIGAKRAQHSGRRLRTRRTAGASRVNESAAVRRALARARQRGQQQSQIRCALRHLHAATASHSRRRPINQLQPHSNSGRGLSAGNGSNGCRRRSWNTTCGLSQRRTLRGRTHLHMQIGPFALGRRSGTCPYTVRSCAAKRPESHSAHARSRRRSPSTSPAFKCRPNTLASLSSSVEGDDSRQASAVHWSTRNYGRGPQRLGYQPSQDQLVPDMAD